MEALARVNIVASNIDEIYRALTSFLVNPEFDDVDYHVRETAVYDEYGNEVRRRGKEVIRMTEGTEAAAAAVVWFFAPSLDEIYKALDSINDSNSDLGVEVREVILFDEDGDEVRREVYG